MVSHALKVLALITVPVAAATNAACGDGPTDGRPSEILSISSLAPVAGSIDGGTTIWINGTGFTAGTVIAFGDQPPLQGAVINSRLMSVVTRAHSAGIVDVVVTSLNGESRKVTGGFTFAASLPPPPALPAPVVTGLEPTLGSTLGGASVRVSGSGFVAGLTFTVDGAAVNAFLYQQSLFVTMPPHAAGAVTVAVRNPDGQIGSLADAYTYIDPSALDFEGEWAGGTGVEWQTPVRFTIRGGVVVAAYCAGASVLPDSATPEVRGGAFTIIGANNAVLMTGRILTNTAATGRINTALCPSDSWTATKADK